MHQRIALLLSSLLLASSALAASKREAAESAYEGARTAYYALKGDAARRKLRHHWLNVAHRFESMASRYPKSERAPEALFTAADLLSELSRISFINEDLHGAVVDYSKLLDTYPKHRLADDAALALARIYVDRVDQPENARRVLTEALGRHTRGDQSREMKELLASLPAPAPAPVKVAAAPTRKASSSKSTKAEPRTVEVSKVGTMPMPTAAVVEAVTRYAREPSRFAPPSAQESVAPKAAEASKKSGTEAVAAAEAPKKPASEAATAELAKKSEPSTAEPARKSDTSSAVAVKPAHVEEKPAPAEPPRPITAPVDAQMAQARLKAVAKDSRHAELTLAEQLGLKVRRVVIDAGHGGHDTGAIGKKGTREKDVSLAIAQKLAAELRKHGLEVLLTRDDDRFIRLEDRARMANEARGDLFISVHCNSAASRSLRGIETYTLNTSADRYSIRLAARENASSEKGISDLQFILADLATKANTEESSRLAAQVQKSLVGELSSHYSGIKSLGTKEALFYVLLGTKMPAILVETSFLSHPEEEERLGSDAYQETVARSVAQGVEAFLDDRGRVAKVD